ncbi:unnamed protein product, partial [Brassica oleracea]
QTYVVVLYVLLGLDLGKLKCFFQILAIRRKPYCGRVPPLSSPFKLTFRFLFFRSEISFAKHRRRSVTAWDHIFSDHIFLDNIFSNCKSFVFCLKDFEIVVVFC